MNITELSQEWQERLANDRKDLSRKSINTPYEVLAYNEAGTRYFHARRICRGTSWAGFGNGSYWKVSYGAVQFRKEKDPFGGIYYELCNGKTYCKSSNGTAIPSRVETKAEVMNICKQIGIFN